MFTTVLLIAVEQQETKQNFRIACLFGVQGMTELSRALVSVNVVLHSSYYIAL